MSLLRGFRRLLFGSSARPESLAAGPRLHSTSPPASLGADAATVPTDPTAAASAKAAGDPGLAPASEKTASEKTASAKTASAQTDRAETDTLIAEERPPHWDTEFPPDRDQRPDVSRGDALTLARQILTPHRRTAALAIKVWPHDPEADHTLSQLGGEPLLPGPEAWPGALHFLAQIHLDALPRTAETAQLPAEGLLSLFIDANAGFPLAAPRLSVLHLPGPVTALRRVPPPARVAPLDGQRHDLPCRDPFAPYPTGFSRIPLSFEPLETVPLLAREGLDDPRVMAADRWMRRDCAAFTYQLELLADRFGPEPVISAVHSVLDDPGFPYTRLHALKVMAYHIDRIGERRSLLLGDAGAQGPDNSPRETAVLDRLQGTLMAGYRRLRDRGLGPEMDPVDRALFADHMRQLAQTAYLAAAVDLNQAALFATVGILSDPSGRHDLIPPQEVARLRQRFRPCLSEDRLFHYHHQLLGNAFEEVTELGADSAALAVEWGWADGPDGDVSLARPSAWRLLLQLGSDSDQETLLSESGTLYLAIPTLDLAQGRFDRVLAHWQGV